LRLTPRPVQQPTPPIWVTVVSTESARKAARRGAKLCTGFHPLAKVVEIFDAFRDEAARIGRKVGPDDLCIRRQVTMLEDDGEIATVVDTQRRNLRKFLEADPRLESPDRPAILDTPTAHAFSVGDEEFVAGTGPAVAKQIIGQCGTAGAGHFAATFDRSRPPQLLMKWYTEYGSTVIPLLRKAVV
jgi:alkanesulfonate monooxygenase SsuD/methylene tetrahydromethanopterin reductase-like flavin-dependent oxidoreductase (luciferase family)